MKTIHLWLWLSIALATLACNVHRNQTILFIGDSFTAGDGMAEKKTFVSLVGQQLANTTTINQGRSGWPTSAYLRRWDEVANRLPESADSIFIQLGANDLRVDGHSEKTIVTCKENMDVIVSRLLSRFPKSEIVLMSSVRIDEDRLIARIRDAGFGEHSNNYLKRIGDAYQQLADKRGLGYLDLIAHLPKDNTHDGAHLSESGHQVVSETIVSYLKQTQ